MATPKLNPSRSIAVIPSDYCNIPNPALYITESTVYQSEEGYIKICLINLIEAGVKIGDIIYNYDEGYGVTITKIDYSNIGPIECPSCTRIFFNAPYIFSPGTSFQIYNGQDDSTGCVLYVGTGGVLKVTTEGGDEVLFQNVPTGSFLPVQVLKVGIEPEADNAKNILALR